MSEKHGFILCVEETLSIALKPFDYRVHGHDVSIEACWCVGDKRVDIEELASLLSKVLKEIDRRPLWEVLETESATIEDLLLYLKNKIERERPGLCALKASWRRRSIALAL
ncbi:MAG: hypothetical protein QXN05_02820 [Acidilobaceae archaeon]